MPVSERTLATPRMLLPPDTDVHRFEGGEGDAPAGFNRIFSVDGNLLGGSVKHVHSNGYRITWIHANHKRPQLFFTYAARRGSFKPTPQPIGVFRPDELEEYVDEYEAKGYRLVQLDSVRFSGYSDVGVACQALFHPSHVVPGPDQGWDYTFYANKTQEEHETLFDFLKETEFRPVNVSVVSDYHTGERSYTALYVENGGWSKLHSDLEPDGYESLVKKHGYPAYVKAYRHDSKTFLSAIWDSPKNPYRKGLSGLTIGEVLSQDEVLDANGYDPIAVSRAGADEQFYAVWEKRGNPKAGPGFDVTYHPSNN